MILTASEDGSFTQTLYSVGGQPVTSSSPYAPRDLAPPAGLTIPAGGSETVSIAQRDAGDPSVATYSIYDASGNLVDVYQPPVADALNNGAMTAPHWQYTYDQSGDELSQTDPMGNVTSWTYDERGNQLTHTLPGGQSESWTYDQFNRVVTHTDMDGDTTWDIYANTPQLFGQQGNDPSRLLAVYYYTGSFTLPDPSEGIRPYQTDWTDRTVYVYDDGTTDPSIGQSTLLYPINSSEELYLGRVMQVQQWTNEDGTAVETDFTDTQCDPITGQPSTITTGEGTINYTYDPVTGNKVRMWTGTDPNNAPDDTAYAYNAQGELTDVYTLVLDDTRYATYTGIDPATHNPTFTGTPLTVEYTYDGAGNLITESQPDDTTTAYTYDDENRLTGENTVNASDATIFSESYVLNADGTRASVTESELQPDGSTATIHTAWTYDSEDRLIGESIDSSLAGQSESETWTYDLDGNRITQLVIANDDTDTTTSTYNSDGELTQTVDTASGTTTYAYDNDGNQITVTNGSNVTSYGYNLQGQLSSVTVRGSTTTYTYDTAGDRTSETTGGTTTYYLNDPNNPTSYAKPMEQWTSSDGNRSDATLQMSYMIGLSIVGQSRGGVVSCLLTDGGGSTRALLNSSGSVTATFNYDAFGDAIGFNPATAGTIYLFGGDGMYDSPSGLYFHGSGRQSDNANDDFIEMDTPGYGSNSNPVSLNLYLLDGADPVNLRDPRGHDLTEEGAAEGIDATVDSIATPVNSAARVAANRAIGRLFQQTVLDLLGVAENTVSNATFIVRNGFAILRTVIPDAVADAVIEIKAAGQLYLSSQIEGEIELAALKGIPFNLIIRVGATISAPLLAAIRDSGGAIFVYNAVTNTLERYL